MSLPLEPLKIPNLKDACVAKLEGLILSGVLEVGVRLPAERNLAEQLGVSRPVIHEALVDLAAKGLVEILPRKGVYVSDYRVSGSCALLESLLAYNEGVLEPAFLESMLAMRLLLEAEIARLAAQQRTEAQLQALRELVERERRLDLNDLPAIVEADFMLHLSLALASGNRVYPLVINSFKSVYTNLSRQFFSKHLGEPLLDEVFAYHQQLLDALVDKNSDLAAATMIAMLNHGAANL